MRAKERKPIFSTALPLFARADVFSAAVFSID
jgi:hypothetical protein